MGKLLDVVRPKGWELVGAGSQTHNMPEDEDEHLLSPTCPCNPEVEEIEGRKPDGESYIHSLVEHNRFRP